MPYHIVKRKGARPYKIVNKDTGKVVGSSETRAKAASSVSWRMAAHTGVKRKKA